ncbi:MAG: DUF433 domain-containing protein [Anaerolinea sp.]|nr:DUF433 domain-containing protein [Anaerolinea sp.]
MLAVQELTDKLDTLEQTVVHLERRLQWVEKREPGKIRTDHPHIVRFQGVCGGRPIIEGTRISVKTVVGWVRLGMSLNEIVEQYPFIAADQVSDALAYYQDHPEEIEAEFAEEQRIFIRNLAEFAQRDQG